MVRAPIGVATLAMGTLLLNACASVPSPRTATVPIDGQQEAVFVLVPHAEPSDDDIEDPALSDIGQARAQALDVQLGHAPLRAIYVDEFRRTRQTATPALTARRGLALSHYFSRGPLQDTAARWRQEFSRGTVLVVGQPEAIAPLAGGLCDCVVTPLRADETDRMIRITRTAGTAARVEDRRYGAMTP